MAERISDYDYFIAVTNYLDFQCRLRMQIGSNDFHLIFDCWEKGVPLRMVFLAISKVVARRSSRNKPIRSFADFSYQIGREFKNFLERNVGSHGEEFPPDQEQDPWKIFFERLPEQFAGLRPQLTSLREAVCEKNGILVIRTLDLLLESFAELEELRLKTELFARSLTPALRKDNVIKRYRYSFLINYLKLPVDLTDWPF